MTGGIPFAIFWCTHPNTPEGEGSNTPIEGKKKKKRNSLTWGLFVEALDPIFFRHMSSVPMGYLAPVASAAKSAKNVFVVGHSSLFASEVLSKPSVGLRRANAVKQALLAKRVRSASV